MPDNLFGGIETQGRVMTYTNQECNRVSGATQSEYDICAPNQGGTTAAPYTPANIGVTTQNPRSTGQAYRLNITTSLPTAGVPHFSVPFLGTLTAGATAMTAGGLPQSGVIPFSFFVPLLWSQKTGGAGTTTTWKALTGRGDLCTAKTSTTDNAVTFPVDIDDSKQSDYLSDSTGYAAVTTAAAAVGNCRTTLMFSRVLLSDQNS